MELTNRVEGPPWRVVRHPKGQRGFGLIEVLLAMLITVVGLLSLLALFAQALATTQLAQLDMIARQKAREALESIYTARNTQQIAFGEVRNSGDGGIFRDGFHSLTSPGPDGLVGTGDDGAIEVMHLPGPDGYRGTPDDEFRVLENFEREIQIQSMGGEGDAANPDMRRITITVRYFTPLGVLRQFQVQSIISRFR